MDDEGKQYEDITRQCIERDCGKEFIITAGEQEFFASKEGFQLPKRCKDCRDRKKRESNSPFGDAARHARQRQGGQQEE